MRTVPALVHSVLLGIPLALVGCTTFVEADPDGPTPGPYDPDGSSPGNGSGTCGGTAYVRTDRPGTALCLDGSNSFTCSFSGNPTTDGVFVNGVHDNSADRLTLCLPDDATNTSCTDFVFEVIYGTGVDLVLQSMGTRAGEYQEVASWDEATAGDNGLCAGAGGGAGESSESGVSGDCSDVEADLAAVWISPEDAVVDPNGFYASLTLTLSPRNGEVAQYVSGASMITPIVDWMVRGSACDELWLDFGQGFGSEYSEIRELTSTALELQSTDGSYYGQVTRYRREGTNEPDPTPSTCQMACASDAECGDAESCASTDDGMVCLASECEGCFAQDQSCLSDTVTCEFSRCVSPSSTCGRSCDMGEPCDPGEECVDTGAGLNCLPPECADCIDGGVLCDYNGEFCFFLECL